MKAVLSKVLRPLNAAVVECVPQGFYEAFITKKYRNQSAALCLHRVTHHRRPTDPYPANTFMQQDLLTLLDILYRLLPPQHLQVTFDDGYLDAVEFVGNYGDRYPDAKFLFFICPEKTAYQAGYRWDLYESLAGGPSFREVMQAPIHIAEENSREDLRGVAADPRFRLATVEQINALAQRPNVQLGNHSNGHFNFATLPDDVWQEELAASFQLFSQLFGPTEHFAFPFGTPQLQFRVEQAQFIKERYAVKVWSTARGGNPLDLHATYLNRFPLAGHLSLKWHLFTMSR